MSAQNLSQDLDYLRSLAEAGERAPLLSGRFYVMWGIILPVAYLAHYLVISGEVGTKLWLVFLWSGVFVFGLIGNFLLVRSLSDGKPGAGSVGNQTSSSVWQFAGMVFGAVFLGLILKTVFGGADPIMFDWFVPIGFSLYCVAMGVSGNMAHASILNGTAYLSAALVPIGIYLVGKPELYLFASVAIVLVSLLPGILLLRREPSQTV